MSRRPAALVFDLGRNLGDNCRGFGLFKAFHQVHSEVELVCWLTPELWSAYGQLWENAGAVERFLVAPRPPRRTYEINQGLIKLLLASGRPWRWDACPPGQGPDGREYGWVVPTGEPWLSAKLLARQGLDEPETINQGQFLAGLLNLSPAQVAQAGPVFGRRQAKERLVCLGLARPRPDDPKQLPALRQERVWRTVLESGWPVAVLDLQDWAPPPQARQVTDMRFAGLDEKVDILNRSTWFIGSDGGLLHLAAASGCATLGLYSGPGPDPGRVFGPWPAQGFWGEHQYINEFNQFNDMIRTILNVI